MALLQHAELEVFLVVELVAAGTQRHRDVGDHVPEETRPLTLVRELLDEHFGRVEGLEHPCIANNEAASAAGAVQVVQQAREQVLTALRLSLRGLAATVLVVAERHGLHVTRVLRLAPLVVGSVASTCRALRTTAWLLVDERDRLLVRDAFRREELDQGQAVEAGEGADERVAAVDAHIADGRGGDEGVGG